MLTTCCNPTICVLFLIFPLMVDRVTAIKHVKSSQVKSSQVKSSQVKSKLAGPKATPSGRSFRRQAKGIEKKIRSSLSLRRENI